MIFLWLPWKVPFFLGCAAGRQQLRTALTALKAIYTLPEEHVNEFLDSYKLFSQEYVTGKNREAENTVNYYKATKLGDSIPAIEMAILGLGNYWV